MFYKLRGGSDNMNNKKVVLTYKIAIYKKKIYVKIFKLSLICALFHIKYLILYIFRPQLFK